MKIKQFFINLWARICSFGRLLRSRAKGIAIGVGVVGVAMAAGTQVEINQVEMPELKEVREWKAPTNDKDWAEDVKKESFNVKHDYQLDQMQQSLTEKLPRVQKELDKLTDCPECIKYETKKELERVFKENGNPSKFFGKTMQELVDEDYKYRLENLQWKTEKIEQSLSRLAAEKDLRSTGKIDRSKEILGTTYYIDCINGTNTAAGTATSTAWRSLDQFAENARSAGDIAIVRRNTSDNGTLATSTTSCADYNKSGVYTELTILSDGTLVSPITITADYINAWKDFASSSQTYTITFGSTSTTASASTTGIVPGQWVYFDGEDPTLYSYEVKRASTTEIEFYLPYKGNKTGAGLTLEVMPANPKWGQPAGLFRWYFFTDYFWLIKGINIRGGLTTNGTVLMSVQTEMEFDDCVVTGNGTNTFAFSLYGYPTAILILNKVRTANVIYSIYSANYGGGVIEVYDSYLSGDPYTTFTAIDFTSTSPIWNMKIVDTVIDPAGTGYGIDTSDALPILTNLRNVSFTSTTKEIYTYANTSLITHGIEDHNGVVGNNKMSAISTSTANASYTLVSTTTVVRSGGGATSMIVYPTSNLGTLWDHSRYKLFEYPIYSSTSSIVYSMYFKVPTTTAASTTFRANPTAAQLWIECDYYRAASGALRGLTKSTTTINALATSSAWQAVSATCQPSQTGILYLRGYYAKTLETGSNYTNIFYMDVQPVITTP